MNFKIVTDSTANLSAEYFLEHGISVVTLFYLFDGKEYPAFNPNNPNTLDQFYNSLKQRPKTSTSCANENSYYEVFEKAYNDGQEILYIGFSSGVSATYRSAEIAQKRLFEKHPDAKIYCVDTLTGSFGQGHFVQKAVEMRANGKTAEDCYNYVLEQRLCMRTFVTVDDLYFLYQGGRIPSLSYRIGSLVKIKPIIEVNTEGKLVAVNKVLSRKFSLTAMFNAVKDNVTDKDVVYIAHGYCLQDANALADKLKAQLQIKNVVVGKLEAVIGAHTGVGSIAIFFLGNKRT